MSENPAFLTRILTFQYVTILIEMIGKIAQHSIINDSLFPIKTKLPI